MMFANGTSVRKDSAPGKPALVQILQNGPTASHRGLSPWVRGGPARQRAYEQVLAGNDAPGRRFLHDHLSGRVDPSKDDTPGAGAPGRDVPHGRSTLDSPDSELTRIGELVPEPGRIPHDPPDRVRDVDRHKWLCASDLLPACEDL